jgi:hypothetical protein
MSTPAHDVKSALEQARLDQNQIAVNPNKLSPTEQFASIFLQIQKNSEWLASYAQKFEALKLGQMPTNALEMEHKAYETSQGHLLNLAFNIWSTNRFPQWAALGQKLYIEISQDKTAFEILIKTANRLALHYLSQAKKLADVSFQQEPHHERAFKEYLITAIYFAEDVIKKMAQQSAAIKPNGNIASERFFNSWVASYCYTLLADIKIKDEDRQLMQRVLGVEDEIPKITEQLNKNEDLIKQRIVIRLGEVINEKKARLSAFVKKENLPIATTTELHTVWDFSELEKLDDLTEYAKKIADRHPETGETVLHILAQRARTARDRAIIQKLVALESQLIKEGKLATKSALAIADNNKQHAADVAVDTKLVDFLGSYPIEGELQNYQYRYEPSSGWGVIPLKQTYALYALRIALQLVNALISTQVPNKGLTLGYTKTPVVVRTAGLEYDYHPADAPQGISCLEKILILDKISNGQAALVFAIAEPYHTNPHVVLAITNTLAKLGLTASKDHDTAWALLVSTIRSQDLRALSALLKIPTYTNLINHIDAEGNSLLSYALEHAGLNQEIACVLVRAGSDPTKIQTSTPGKTTHPFKLAVYYGYDKVVNEMIIQIIMKKKWPSEQLQEQLDKALFRAVFTGQDSLVTVLLKYKANPNKTLDDKTLCAVFTQYIEADTPGYDRELLGDTPFLWAIGLLSGIGYTQPIFFAKMVDTFLQHPQTDKSRVTVSRMNHCLLPKYMGIQKGDNPLMVAIHACSYSNNRSYHTKVLSMLCAGANPQVIAFNGKTAYQIAGELLLNDLVRLLDNFKANGPQLIAQSMAVKNKAHQIQIYLAKLLHKDKEFSTHNTAKRGIEAFGLTGKIYLTPEHFQPLNQLETKDGFYRFIDSVERMCFLLSVAGSHSEYYAALSDFLDATDVYDVAKKLSNTFATYTQLNGWKMVLDYINDPRAFLERIKAVRSKKENAPAPRSGGGHFSVVNAWDATGTTLVYDINSKNIIVELQNNPYIKEALFLLTYFINLAYLSPDPTVTLEEQALCVLLLMTKKYKTQKEKELDLSFVTRSTEWMKTSELCVTNMLNRNPTRYAAFRDLQKRGVNWPHSSEVRKNVESAAFAFRPMMVKRDRCVCDICGVEVTGWKKWNNPWRFHNYEKHPDDFKAKATKFGGIVFTDVSSTAPVSALSSQPGPVPTPAPVPGPVLASGPAAPLPTLVPGLIPAPPASSGSPILPMAAMAPTPVPVPVPMANVLDSKYNAEAVVLASSAASKDESSNNKKVNSNHNDHRIEKMASAQLIAAQEGVARQLMQANAAAEAGQAPQNRLQLMFKVLQQAEAFLDTSSLLPTLPKPKRVKE